VTFDKEFHEEHPLVEKLALYILAHKNYLDSLSFEMVKLFEVNWGLKKVKALEESYTRVKV